MTHLSIVSLAAALLLALPATAQSDKTLHASAPSPQAPQMALATGFDRTGMSLQPISVPRRHRAVQTQQTDSTVNVVNQQTNLTPPPSEELGEESYGLHVSLDASVFGAFGKHARHGAGFAQRLTATYLTPISRKAWLAVGGYVNHINWSGDSYTNGGLYAEVGYQFDEHWAAYVYGQKNLVNSGLGYTPYYYSSFGLWGTPYYNNELGDRLGAAVQWRPSKSMSVELRVEKDWLPSTQRHGYNRVYDYQK